METQTQIEIYQSKDGALQLPVHMQEDSVWLSAAQLVTLFGRDKSVISRHINNLFKEQELAREAVVAKYATTAKESSVVRQEGKRHVRRKLNHSTLHTATHM